MTVNVLEKFKKMGTAQLERRVAKLHQDVRGVAIDTSQYDRDGLLELVGYLTSRPVEEPTEMTVVEYDADPSTGKPKRSTRRTVKYQVGDSVLMITGEYTGLSGTVSAIDGTDLMVDLGTLEGEDPTTEDHEVRVSVADVKRAKVAKVKEPRKRRLSDEVIREIRAKRDSENLSYAKLAKWLEETHGQKVTGDLVRSIIIREIYTDVK